eukprot:1184796-Prorocentrum_minimum.AAC.2
MVQLRKRFEKAESDKSIGTERLRALTKEHRGVCKQRDDLRERADTAVRCGPSTPPMWDSINEHKAGRLVSNGAATEEALAAPLLRSIFLPRTRIHTNVLVCARQGGGGDGGGGGGAAGGGA